MDRYQQIRFVGVLLILLSLQPVLAQDRDPWLRPFSDNSIWNTSIGREAKLIAADLPAESQIVPEIEYIYETHGFAFDRPVIKIASRTRRFGGTEQLGQIAIEDFILGAHYNDLDFPNACAAILDSNKRVVHNLTAFCRIQQASPLYAASLRDWDFHRGDGFDDGRIASGMSILGGSICYDGENNVDRIDHAIKICVPPAWLYYDNASQGYCWPAIRAGENAAKQYRGTNPHLKLGSLLTLPESELSRIEMLSKPFAKALGLAAYRYGVYVVDETSAGRIGICMTPEALLAIRRQESESPTKADSFWSTELDAELRSILSALCVVEDNSSESIGGHGERRFSNQLPPRRAMESVEVRRLLQIQNGSMSNGFVHLTEWIGFGPDRFAIKLSQDRRTFYSPPASMKLASSTDREVSRVVQFALVREPAPYDVTGMIRLQGKAKAKLKIFVAIRGVREGTEELVYELDQLNDDATKDSGWLAFSKHLIPPENQRGMRVELSLEGDGVVWLDDILAQKRPLAP